MNRKYYRAITLLVLATLAFGLHAIWQAQSRQPKQTRTDNSLIEQTAYPQTPAPLVVRAVPDPERAEHTPQQDSTSPAVVSQPLDTLGNITAAEPVAPERTASASSTRLVIEATPIPMLPAALQKRYPSARTIEPVGITSLPEQLALRGSPDEPLQRLQLPAPHGRTVDVVVQQHRQIHARRGTISGKVAGIAHSEVIVSYAEEAMTASVIIPGTENMEIAYAGNGCHVLLDIDPAKILPNAPPLIPQIEIAKSAFP